MTPSENRIVADMKRANTLIDESVDVTDYQVRMIALALMARQFLREVARSDLIFTSSARPTDRQEKPK